MTTDQKPHKPLVSSSNLQAGRHETTTALPEYSRAGLFFSRAYERAVLDLLAPPSVETDG